jgi:hypothetical protein
MTKEARMPNDKYRKGASDTAIGCMRLAVRASEFVILSSLGISSFVIVPSARRLNVTLSIQGTLGHSEVEIGI